MENETKVLGSTYTQEGYWSPNDILDLNCQYNFILGGRGTGKSYAILKLAIENYFKTGEQFAYVRRLKESIGPSKVRCLLAPHYDLIEQLSGGEWNSVYVYRQTFYLELIDKETGKRIAKNPKPLGILSALSTQNTDKGQDLGYMRYILFDEILDVKYLPDEWTKFQNVISSLVRNREGTKIFMIGNPLSRFCPYFDNLGININEAKQGTITVISYKGTNMKCAFEYLADRTNFKESEIGRKIQQEYFAFDNCKVKSITEGVWELDEVAHLDSHVYGLSEKKHIIGIKFSGKEFVVEILKYEHVYYLFFRPTNEIKPKTYYFSTEKELNQYCMLTSGNPIGQVFKKIFNTGQVYYSDNTTGNYIHGWLKAMNEISF